MLPISFGVGCVGDERLHWRALHKKQHIQGGSFWRNQEMLVADDIVMTKKRVHTFCRRAVF